MTNPDISLSGAWLEDCPPPVSQYDLYVDHYDAEHAGSDFDHKFWMRFASQDRLVGEIGCGSGRITEILSECGPVVGIDPSEKMLNQARVRAPAAQDFRVGDLRSLPADNEEFDAALCIYGSFIYLPSPQDQLQAARELFRVVKSGGEVVIDVPFYAANSNEVSGAPSLRWTHETPSVDQRKYQAYWQSQFDARWNLLDITQIIDLHASGGELVSRQLIRHRTTVFTVRELAFLAVAVGLEVTDVFGNYEAHPFTEGASRIILVARKP